MVGFLPCQVTFLRVTRFPRHMGPRGGFGLECVPVVIESTE